MKILHVANSFSGRAAKIMKLLQQEGHDQALCISQMPAAFVSWGMQFPVCSVSNVAGMKALAAEYDRVWLHVTLDSQRVAGMAKAGVCKDRLIVDVHDHCAAAQLAANVADRVVVPSGGYLKFYPEAEVVYSKVPKAWVPADVLKSKGMCLISCVMSQPDYRDYRPVYEHYTKGLESFDIFAGNNSDLALQLPMYQVMDYWAMLKQVARYRWGYAGPAGPGVDIDDVVTNKFWEYLACGVEPLFGPWEKPREMHKLMQQPRLDQNELYMESELPKVEAVLA